MEDLNNMTSAASDAPSGYAKENLKKHIARENRGKFFRAMFSRRIVIIGLIGLLFFILLAVFAPYITRYDPSTMDSSAILQTPNPVHWLGTDNFGRDTFSRLVYGARISLIVGVLAVSLAAVIGISLGMIAGYTGGIVDLVIMRIMEAIMAIPGLMVHLALVAVIGNSVTDLAVILSVTTIPTYVRMTRAMTLSIRNSDYVRAARIVGVSRIRILLDHILPNTIPHNIVQMVGNVGRTILQEAALSFLGVGITIPTPSWGTMVSEGSKYLLDNPTIALVPGFCVALLVISLNLLGDGVRDAMDPRLRGES